MTGLHWDFLCALVCCVRAFTISQAMRFTGIRNVANFRRWLKPLVAHGLVEVVTVLAKPVPEMKGPLYVWEPQGLGPMPFPVSCFLDVLQLAHARWAGLSAVPQRVVIASKRGGNLFGVRRCGKIGKPLQASHDLTVSAVALRYAEQVGHIENWVGEDFSDACELDGCVLDAVILDSTGLPQKGIEVVGSDYDEPRIRRTCQQCHVKGIINVELW